GVVADARGGDERVGRLVAGDADAALEDLVDAGPCRAADAGGAGGGRRGAGGAGRARAEPRRAEDLVQRLREVFAARVLERQDMELAVARGLDVEALDELEHAHVVGLGGGDDERVAAVVGDDAGPARAAAAGCAALAAGCARRAGLLEV